MRDPQSIGLPWVFTTTRLFQLHLAAKAAIHRTLRFPICNMAVPLTRHHQRDQISLTTFSLQHTLRPVQTCAISINR